MIVPDLLDNAARRWPDRPCLVAGARTLSFGDVDRRAGQLAMLLARHGVQARDRVAILARNEPEYLEVQLAAMRLGAALVPLNVRLAASELETIIADCTPQVLVYSHEFSSLAERLRVAHRWQIDGEGAHGYQARVDSVALEAVRPPISAEATATIYYTSGTTGRPKGVVVSCGAVYAGIWTFSTEAALGPGDVYLQVMPMFHIAFRAVCAAAFVGATTIVHRSFDGAALLSEVAQRRVTHLLVVPTMLNELCELAPALDPDLDSLKVISYSASAIAPDLLRRAISRFRCDFLQIYGLTETASATVLRPDDHRPPSPQSILSSAGRACLGAEVGVIDASGAWAPPGETGEIVCRGPSLMDRYWCNDELTRSVTTDDGWFRTGDLGRLDDQGYLFVTGRQKDMIVSGGENVYPCEVEDVLYAHPAVLDAAVVGLPHPKWGEQVTAALVVRPDHELRSDDVKAHLRAHLADYKLAKLVFFVDDLPKNATGKIDKLTLQASLRAQLDLP